MTTDRDAAIDALLTKDALREIAMRYTRAIDRRDKALLRTVYHDDAWDEHGTVFSGPAPEFCETTWSFMTDYELTNHYIANTSYRIEGDRADGELYFIAYHRTSGPEHKHAIVTGRYLDNYERRNGDWKIAYRRLVWDTAITLDMPAADMELLKSLGKVGGFDDDYSYDALPLMGRGL